MQFMLMLREENTCMTFLREEFAMPTMMPLHREIDLGHVSNVADGEGCVCYVANGEGSFCSYWEIPSRIFFP